MTLYLPCYDSVDPHNFWACTPPVWRTATFLALAFADAACVGSFYIAMLHAPRYVTGGEARGRMQPHMRARGVRSYEHAIMWCVRA